MPCTRVRGPVFCLRKNLCLLRKSVSTPGKMEMAYKPIIGGGVLVHALHPCKGPCFLPSEKLMSAQKKCIYSWENGNGV